MTDDDQRAWEEWGTTVCWQVGAFSCCLQEVPPTHLNAIIAITWMDGQCEHEIAVARTITVAEAKRKAAERIIRELARWLDEAEALRTGGKGETARTAIHIGLMHRANRLNDHAKDCARYGNAEHANGFRASRQQTVELAELFVEGE